MDQMLPDIDLQKNIEILRSQYEVVRIADGLGFGEGSISVDDRVRNPEDALQDQTLRLVDDVIKTEQILKPAGVGDGCGDGRPVNEEDGVLKIFGSVHERQHAKDRAKIFGGGAAMVGASLIGLGHAAGEKLNGLFSKSIKLLRRANISFGAHTDNRANEINSGCGAIDKANVIIKNAGKFRQQISDTLSALPIDADQAAVSEIFDEYAKYEAEIDDEPYVGKKVVDEIIDQDHVVKELADDHKEVAIVLNDIEGTTVDQEKIREASNNQAQVFAVDVWRLRFLANKLFKQPADQQKAFLSMLVYTLATAGTLTKGDLPVYMVQKPAAEVAA